MFRSHPKPNLFVGLDLGSHSIRVAIGQSFARGEAKARPRLQLIGAVEVPASGMRKGVVSSLEEVVSSVSHALEEAERLVGVPLESAWVGITGTHIMFQGSKGVVAVAKTDGEISGADVERAVEAAQMVAAPLNYEVLHVLPRLFAVDGQTGIRDPIGMTGIRLEVDTQIVYGLTTHIKNITKAVYRTGLDINDLVVSIFAVGDLVTTRRQKELGVAVVDIGGSTTSLIVYEEGEIMHMAVLPIGSESITNDIAIGLKTMIDIADRLKCDYGSCLETIQSKKEIIDLQSVGAAVSEAVSEHYLGEIIRARVEEILDKVNKELLHIKRAGLLPAGVVFTGGGAKLAGLVEFAKEYLHLPCSLGYPLELESISEKVQDVGFATAIGLALWGSQLSDYGRAREPSRLNGMGGNLMKQGKKFLRMLIP